MMRIHSTWEDIATNEERPIVLVIGAFDGIHRGHQFLIQTAQQKAVAESAEAWLLTFDPHPSRILRPNQGPPLLTSTEHKLRLLRGTGLHGVIVHPFTLDLATLSPEQFWSLLTKHLPHIKAIIVGTNWRFGYRAAGDVTRLRQLAEAQGVEVCVPDPVEWDDSPISSTRIREAVENGDLQSAETMLGRPFSLLGTVTTGKQYGRQLGFPTANIRLQDEARPPTGVYAVTATWNDTEHEGAAYLGIRPTDHGKHTHYLLEVHLLNINPNLYGEDIEVAFLKFLRGDQRFDSHDALKTQIARDVAQARAFFGG